MKMSPLLWKPRTRAGLETMKDDVDLANGGFGSLPAFLPKLAISIGKTRCAQAGGFSVLTNFHPLRQSA